MEYSERFASSNEPPRKPPSPSILALHYDIFWIIIKQGELEIQDLKSLRRVCRQLEITTKPIFFSRLKLSRAYEDQDKFREFPLQFVKEIIWEEECWGEFDRSLAIPPKPFAELVTNPESLGFSAKQAPRSWWSDWFLYGMKSMQSLTTITIRIERGPNKRHSSYDNPLNRHGRYRHLRLSTNSYDRTYCLTTALVHNLTYFDSFGIAVAFLALCQHTSRITNLNLAIVVPQLGYGVVCLRDWQAFRNLTTISICVIPNVGKYPINRDITILFIQAAKRLINLKLCFPSDPDYYGDDYRNDKGISIPWRVAFVSNLFDKPHWPLLHSFHILNHSRFINTNNDNLNRDNYSVLKNGGMVPISKLGAELRTLQMDNCCVNYVDLQWIRERRCFLNSDQSSFATNSRIAVSMTGLSLQMT